MNEKVNFTPKKIYHQPEGTIYQGDALEVLRTLPDESVNCCVTSPPYWGLRDYGCAGQIGLEASPDEFVSNMVRVLGDVRRVLRDDGTLWLNFGDLYAGSRCGGQKRITASRRRIKPKDLVGVPWMVAFALRDDGWYLRQDIIWCLSGGTQVYARTQKREMPITIKDLSRLDPSTVKLWNGKKWTQLLGISKSQRKGEELELLLRSGERISCTPTHKFPTDRGLLEAKDIQAGDCLESTGLPEPQNPKSPSHIGLDAAWFAGLYIAEGSKSQDCIQISGHIKEKDRWTRLSKIAEDYGGYITRTITGNKMDIRLYGKILNSLIEEFVSGRTGKDKCLAPVCWEYDNVFLNEILDGYLSGDGHRDKKNNRWRLGFTRNYNLERDLRVLAARLGLNLTLNMTHASIGDKNYKSFRGEIRSEYTFDGHWNQKKKSEVVEIRKSRARQFYDIGVEDEPHLFALASGILTHNSKPNPMPESVKDRCTKAHEYIFLLSKSQQYYYDHEAIKENRTSDEDSPSFRGGCYINGQIDNDVIGKRKDVGNRKIKTYGKHSTQHSQSAGRRMVESVKYARSKGGGDHDSPFGPKRNKRSVWSVATSPFSGAHFATFPPKLIEPCILAGCPTGGVVLDPFFGSGTAGLVAYKHDRKFIGIDLSEYYLKEIAIPRIQQETQQLKLFN